MISESTKRVVTYKLNEYPQDYEHEYEKEPHYDEPCSCTKRSNE